MSVDGCVVQSLLLLGLEIVEQNRAFLRFLAPIADDDAGAVDDFAGVALAVEHAYEERSSSAQFSLFSPKSQFQHSASQCALLSHRLLPLSPQTT